MVLESGVQSCCTGFQDLSCATLVDVLWGHERDSAMAVLSVVPTEEWAAESPGVLQGDEALWKPRTILEGLEL